MIRLCRYHIYVYNGIRSLHALNMIFLIICFHACMQYLYLCRAKIVLKNIFSLLKIKVIEKVKIELYSLNNSRVPSGSKLLCGVVK